MIHLLWPLGQMLVCPMTIMNGHCLLIFTLSFEGPTSPSLVSSSIRPVCTLPLPCFQQLATIKLCNTFVLITIRIAGGGSTPFGRRRSPNKPLRPPTKFRIFFQVPYALSPLFATLTKTTRVGGLFFPNWNALQRFDVQTFGRADGPLFRRANVSPPVVHSTYQIRARIRP